MLSKLIRSTQSRRDGALWRALLGVSGLCSLLLAARAGSQWN
jgi:hypothetical protein